MWINFTDSRRSPLSLHFTCFNEALGDAGDIPYTFRHQWHLPVAWAVSVGSVKENTHFSDGSFCPASLQDPLHPGPRVYTFTGDGHKMPGLLPCPSPLVQFGSGESCRRALAQSGVTLAVSFLHPPFRDGSTPGPVHAPVPHVTDTLGALPGFAEGSSK